MGLEARMTRQKEKAEVQEIDNKEFDAFIKKNIVIIDFYAEWCMPCLMMAPIIETLASEYYGKITFGKINIDDNKEVASKYKIMSIPSLVVFKKGAIVDKIVGALSYEILSEKIKKILEDF